MHTYLPLSPPPHHSSSLAARTPIRSALARACKPHHSSSLAARTPRSRFASALALVAFATPVSMALGFSGTASAEFSLAPTPSTFFKPRVSPLPAPSEDPSADTTHSVWRPDLDVFAASDKVNRPQQGGVLFVGSSTIRMWSNLAQDFRQQPIIINRGFGGSTLAACNFFATELVLQYRPSQVLIYAGENDLTIGRSPQDVMQSFIHLSEQVRAELPEARIAFISIKPSPSRKHLLMAMQQTNRLIEGYLEKLPNSQYIDTHYPMLGSNGKPRDDLFLADMLHMNEAGYALWQEIIAPYLGNKGGGVSVALSSPVR